MNKRLSLGIDFLIRKSSANDDHSLIFARITVDGQSKEISIKEKIRTKEWDWKSETVRGRSVESKSINEHIDSVRYRLKEKFRQLEDKGELNW